MISFIMGVVLLIAGYFTYGKVVERLIGPDDRRTPAYTKEDGVDFIPMKASSSFLIQDLAQSSELFQVLFGDQ